MEMVATQVDATASGDYFCTACTLLAVDVDPEPPSGETLDEIVVLGEQQLPDGSVAELMVLEVSGTGSARTLVARDATQAFPDFDFHVSGFDDQNPRSTPLARDLDDDGVAEILALAVDATTYKQGVAVLWNDQNGAFTETTFIVDPAFDVEAFAVLELDDEPSREIVVTVDGMVVRLDIDPDIVDPGAKITPISEGRPIHIWWDEEKDPDPLFADVLTAGDFDGDGLDDLVAGDLAGYYLLRGEADKP
jgi:hypothetical protein